MGYKSFIKVEKGHSLNILKSATNSYTKYCELVGFLYLLGIPENKI